MIDKEAMKAYAVAIRQAAAEEAKLAGNLLSDGDMFSEALIEQSITA
jgi:hypothetical protein